MGLADRSYWRIGALYARAMDPELFQGDSFSNTYSQVRDLDRAENKQLERNNPWTYGGANLLGGVAMPIGMAGQGLKGAVKAGGIAGGLTGYGMSEKTNPYALALDTVTGAGLGAVLARRYMGWVRLQQIHRFRNSQKIILRMKVGL